MRLHKTRIFLFIVAVGSVLFMLFGAVTMLGVDRWANFDMDKITLCDTSTVLYDSDGHELLRLHSAEDRTWVSLSALPPHVYNAFISAEDARFFEHEGIDIIRIGGAIIADIRAWDFVQGASTISQQLVKLSHLTSEKTISRKAEEAVLAYQMERRCTKEQILEMYLNYVYFGGGYYGVEAASLGYFGVHAREMSIAQSAMLAGILKSPSNYAPHINYEQSIDRRNTVLKLMEEYGYISREDKYSASTERTNIVHGQKEEYSGYYSDGAIRQAAAVMNMSVDQLSRGGYNIYTAMDSGLQEYCEELFKRDELFPTPDAQGAMVIQQPESGLVLAMIGGREHDGSLGFNRATDIRRQPGSVIKPIIAYAPAFEYLGCTAADMLLDEQMSFDDYSPSNFGQKYYGWVTMREAVTRSLNVPAVKVLSEVGVERAKQFAASCGIDFDPRDNSLALALGGFTYGVSPMQIAGAYSCFCDGGKYNTPSMITKITDRKGNILYQYKPEQRPVMSEENAYILTSMLKSVITEGTGKRLNTLNIPIAGKTGTVGISGGNRDAWMASYTPDYTAVVWMGYDSDAMGILPQGATGGSYPALMLYEVYGRLYPNGTDKDFIRPEGVAEYTIDSRTRDLSHKTVLSNALTPEKFRITEFFTPETAPKAVTDYWVIPAAAQNLSVDTVNGQIEVSFDCPDDFAEYSLYRRASGQAERLIGRWAGTEGHIQYVDTTARPGMPYRYYVTSCHDELTIGGKKVYGLNTHEVQAQMTE